MIKDHTIDQCLVELSRTMAALKALRGARKREFFDCRGQRYGTPPHFVVSREHAAALRASLDLTRKLADLRQGR